MPASLTALLAPLVAPLVVVLGQLDPAPDEDDVKAGYPALFLFLGLLVVVGLLGWSLFRHLKRAEDNQRAGLFGDVPASLEVTEAEAEARDAAGREQPSRRRPADPQG